MDLARFQTMVSRLDIESASSPRVYKVKVALLIALGYGLIIFIFLSAILTIALIVGIFIALTVVGKGAAFMLGAKLVPVAFAVAIPLWFLLKGVVRVILAHSPPSVGRKVVRNEAPVLFAELDKLRSSLKGPLIHEVHLWNGMQASIAQHSRFGIFGWNRSYLHLGLPLFMSLSPEEGRAVLAHEYGHLSGAHGRFGAFIYRFRSTLGVIESQSETFEGRIGRLISRIVGWYGPYLNAYTYVLARNQEICADAESAKLAGALNAAHALKRTFIVSPAYEKFMGNIFDLVKDHPEPPSDVMIRWNQEAKAVEDSDAQTWLNEALDRETDPLNTHPSLRQRLVALPQAEESIKQPPPQLEGLSAAEAWLGHSFPLLMEEMQMAWQRDYAQNWLEQHENLKSSRKRLDELGEMQSRNRDEDFEYFILIQELEPEYDLLEKVHSFNAVYPEDARGLFMEGTLLLKQKKKEGLELLDQAMRFDSRSTKAACRAAYDFLIKTEEYEAADKYARLYRQRERDELVGVV